MRRCMVHSQLLVLITLVALPWVGLRRAVVPTDYVDTVWQLVSLLRQRYT